MFKLSPEANLDGAVTVENKFIVDYMPYADGDYVKVYLYGLSLAMRKADPDDTEDRLARRLGLDRATVDAAISYWEDQGLMARLGDDIAYLPPRSARPKIKKYDVDKYAEFNRLSQSYIDSRQIAPSEYNDYYALMEKYGLEWQAMVLIVRYCVNLKGGNVSCPYILAVARNLAEDGYRTYDDVENRLEEYGVYYADLCAVFAAMGGKRPDHEAVRLYKKWIKEYKFDKSVILETASAVKHGGAATLDYKLTRYHELGLMSSDKINAYEAERKDLFALAKAVNKALGLYYENVEPEISSYISPWLDMGFEKSAIVAIAEYCMKNGLKTLGDLDAVMRDFLARSALTESSVHAYTDYLGRYDGKIAELMKKLDMLGAVKSSQRMFYSNWTDKLGCSDELIDYCAQTAVGKANPFAYMNAVLSEWHAAGITTADAAKARSAAARETAAAAPPKATVVERYSADELNALLTRLSDDE